MAEFAYNNSVYLFTNIILFQVYIGKDSYGVIDLELLIRQEALEDRALVVYIID